MQLLVDWCSAAWSDLDVEIVKRSFIQTGVTNNGEVDPDVLHSKLKQLLEGGGVEDIQKAIEEMDKEDATGTSDEEEEEEEGEGEEEDDAELPDV